MKILSKCKNISIYEVLISLYLLFFVFFILTLIAGAIFALFGWGRWEIIDYRFYSLSKCSIGNNDLLAFSMISIFCAVSFFIAGMSWSQSEEEGSIIGKIFSLPFILTPLMLLVFSLQIIDMNNFI